jgi:hypothetical protein
LIGRLNSGRNWRVDGCCEVRLDEAIPPGRN